MGLRVSHKLWASAAILAVVVAGALPGRALDGVTFTVTGGDKALTRDLRAASGLVGAGKDKAALDLFADARAEYGKLLSALYAAGHYGPVIHVLIDGREADSMAPLDAPSAIGKVVVTVDPGPAFVLSTPQIVPLAAGQSLPSGFVAGKGAGAGVIMAAVQAGIDGWRGQGHGKAAVAEQTLTADHASATLSVAVRLNPGPVLRFGDLSIKGATHIRPNRLRKIAGLPTGHRFDPAEEARAAQRLRRSGVFSSVTLSEDESITPPDLLGITADVVEALPRRYSLGAEVATNDGLRLNGSWLHRNLLGGGERFEVTGAVSNIVAAGSGTDYALGTTLDRPATPDADTTLNLSATLGHKDDADYTADTLALGFGLTHYFSDTLTAHAAVAYDFSNGQDSAGDFTYRSLQLPLGAVWDHRDSKTEATRGYYLDLGAKPFFGFGATENGARLTVDARAYKALGGGGAVLAGRIQGGAILGASALGTPRTDLFYSGGGGTVRGQAYQSLGISVLDGATWVDTGGTAFVAASVEARVKVSGNIGVVGFVDAGAVGEGTVTGANSDWQAGAGLGLRYGTAVGPIRLDLAMPVRGALDGGVQIYVGLGQAF
ncbi:MAG: BamA/TamA family outer membrane protein [Pseudomonadota bacterium]